jgi:predicted AAA+ superfamily ATPase
MVLCYINAMDDYIRRDIEKEIKEYVEQFSAVSLTGPRQSGKTTTLKRLFKGTHGYVSLDKMSDRRLALEDTELFVERLPEKVIIDEAQYAPDLFSYLKIKIDENPRIKGRYILTGSQNFLLMKSFTETLAGRIGILHMPLLSSPELKSMVKGNHTTDFFEKACLTGTYPEPILGVKDISKWYEGYLQIYIERDVRTLYNVGSLREFDKFLRLLAGRPGQILNMSSFATDVGVTIPTIKSWISILEASGIIYILYPYHANIRTRLVKSPKIYFMDTGLVCHLNSVTSSSGLYKHSMFGQIFENYALMEAVKLFSALGKREMFSFFRADKGIEIDLIVEIGDHIIPFEFKASMNFEKKWAFGIESLIDGKIKHKVEPGYIVCLNDKVLSLSKNTKTMGVFEMLDVLKSYLKK